MLIAFKKKWSRVTLKYLQKLSVHLTIHTHTYILSFYNMDAKEDVKERKISINNYHHLVLMFCPSTRSSVWICFLRLNICTHARAHEQSHRGEREMWQIKNKDTQTPLHTPSDIIKLKSIRIFCFFFLFRMISCRKPKV